MTTPRDDIAGLSERLRRLARITRRAIETSKLVFPWKTDSKTLDEAATQLDSLLKERDALQARVKELEARPPLLDAKSIPRVDALMRTFESRALRAEQERDTLARVMEDTATELGCEPNNETILEAIVGLQQERDEAYEQIKSLARVYWKGADVDRKAVCQAVLGVIAETNRRLASGPEKEKEQ